MPPALPGDIYLISGKPAPRPIVLDPPAAVSPAGNLSPGARQAHSPRCACLASGRLARPQGCAFNSHPVSATADQPKRQTGAPRAVSRMGVMLTEPAAVSPAGARRTSRRALSQKGRPSRDGPNNHNRYAVQPTGLGFRRPLLRSGHPPRRISSRARSAHRGQHNDFLKIVR
jgi:hypothetical protein